MAEYRCIRNCFFDNRYHHAGRKYSFPDNLKVPHHFAAIGTKEAKAVEEKLEAEKAALKDEPTTMHEMARKRARVAGDDLKKHGKE